MFLRVFSSLCLEFDYGAEPHIPALELKPRTRTTEDSDATLRMDFLCD